jgi:phosphoglucosamine mutase
MPATKFFGTDGIRAEVGVYPLVPDFVLKLGLTAGSVLREKSRHNTVVIGRDTRQSGPMLQSALTAGLLASGVSVIDAGVITTPGVAYLVRKLEAAAGIVISASHNPVGQNGIKFFDGQGLKLPEGIEIEIEQRLDLPLDSYRQYGRSIDGRGMQELYLENLLSEHVDLRLDKLLLVLDCANGAASWYGPECFARLGARVVATQASPTGLNINDRAGSEYIRQSPEEVGRLVQHYGARFGVAFDGDADRVIFVDGRGEVYDGDHILAILARDLDDRGLLVARTLVASNMRNQGLAEFARKHQMPLIETPVGDKYIAEKLLDLRAQNPAAQGFAVGGEQSGHVMILDNDHTTGDGIRTALFVISAFVRSGAESLAEFASRIIQKTPQVIASAFVGGGPRLDRAALSELETTTQAEFPALQRINLRYSGTEALFRAMLEANHSVTEMELARVAWGVCRKVQAAAGAGDGVIEIQNCSCGGLLHPEDIRQLS